MLSAMDLERLIAVKRLEIEKEKTFLGLSSQENNVEDDQSQDVLSAKPKRSVSFNQRRDLCDYNVPGSEDKKERDATASEQDIPADLERYIRRYLGLPVMLKAGEYSPNNPLVRGERPAGDALLGLGEYERRRDTLRRLRQQQYREYLDQQAKKKQEAKEQAEKERREQEEKERERDEREREREREESERERERERERRRGLERRSPERRRASLNTVNYGSTLSYNKVDTGVQVDCKTAPLSVAVQTDDSDLFRLPSPTKSQLTQAERELSPHTAADAGPRPAPWTGRERRGDTERRRSYGDFDERSSTLLRKSTRDKLTSDLRHSYMPSIFDADAIQMRNMQAEKEAAARRQFYQQELKNQILEQQRIREERKTREKMLEAAEMRRLEEQLRMLRAAQDTELERHQQFDTAIKEDSREYDKKRKELQKDIDTEQVKLIRAPLTTKRLPPARCDNEKLPYYYPLLQERNKDPPLLKERSIESAYFHERPIESSLFKDKLRESPLLQERPKDRKPYSTNIPDDSIFSPNYDVDGYLRRNLNFKAFELKNKDFDSESVGAKEVNVEKVQMHDLPKVKPIPKERKSILPQESVDSLPIPVLRHSPVTQLDRVESGSDLSDAMKKVDDKWKVPVVQKNILKSIPNEEGKSVSILTQLGSIRRQLQLEQLKLDRKLSKDDDIA